MASKAPSFTTNVGIDPEFVVLTKAGVPVPAHKVGIEQRVPGTKVSHFRDGFNIEVNTMKSHYCRALCYGEFKGVIRAITSKLGPQYTLASVPAYRVRSRDILEAPDDVKQFGCSPSKSAYKGGADGVVDLDGAKHKWRYAGGHLHVSAGIQKPGLAFHDPAHQPQLVKWLDYYLGLAATYVFDRPEQYKRRRYYGRAGEYRHQKYAPGIEGIEYRVPGPEVFNHQAFFALFMGIMQKVILDRGDTEGNLYKGWKPEWDKPLQDAINKGEGLEEMLKPVVVNGFYNFATLKALKEKMGDERFAFDPASPHRAPDAHTAWGEFATDQKLPGPHKIVGSITQLAETV